MIMHVRIIFKYESYNTPFTECGSLYAGIDIAISMLFPVDWVGIYIFLHNWEVPIIKDTPLKTTRHSSLQVTEITL